MGAERARTARRRRWAVFAAAWLASLGAAELWVRAWIGAPLAERLPLLAVRAHPERGWEMVPGRAHYTYHHRVQVNALGLRGPELAPRREGEVRLFFLGDSMTYGQGVADDETMPAALEQALRARDPGRPWTVVNGGLRAYGTTQELALLAELGPPVQPDVVLLGWYWNDLDEREIAATHAELAPKGEFYFDTGNRLEGLARGLWHVREYARRSAVVMLAHDLLVRPGELYPPAVLERGMQRLPELLDRFAEQCARLGALPVVVVYPDRHRLLGSDATRALEERAAALARERGLAVVELLPALESLAAARGRLPILPFDNHYDAEANRAMGAHLAERLRALGVPKRAE